MTDGPAEPADCDNQWWDTWGLPQGNWTAFLDSSLRERKGQISLIYDALVWCDI